MKKVLLFFTLALPFLGAAQDKVDKRFKGIDKKVEKIMEAWNGSGFAVAVVDKNQIVYASGFGYKDYDKKEKVTTETLFPIGSCTKAFTDVLIGQLAEEDKLDLDDSPRDYLPKLHFFNSEMDQMITIRDMMCHRTGLPRHDFSWYFFPTDSRQELIERIAYQEPSAGIREDWQYNNFMYMALGAITEEITGMSWEENIDNRIFSPLGMNNSNLLIRDMEANPDHSLGYSVSPQNGVELEDFYEIKGMSPAGAINSNVNEMSNWLITWLNKGEFRGEKIFPASYYQEAISPQMAIGGTPGEEHPDLHATSYGLGWFLSSYRGHYRVEHGGNINGFSASMVFYPSDSLGIVVLANENGSGIPSAVRNTIADHVLGLEEIDWTSELIVSDSEENENGEKASEDVSRIMNTKPSHELEAYTGTFTHPGYGSFEITVENDSLFAKSSNTKVWLMHYHYDIFEPYMVKNGEVEEESFPGPKFNFQTSNLGDISAINLPLQMGVEPLIFERDVKELEMESNQLMAYVGDYELEGIVCKVYLDDQKKMKLSVPGQPEYTLVPVGEDKFHLKDIDGYALQFVKADDQKIQSVQFIQPNGTFVAKRK